MHAARRQLRVVLAVLLIALPSGAAGGTQYFCRMMGRVMTDTCCCAKAKAARAAKRQSFTREIKAKDCCERIERAAREGAPAIRDGATHVESPVVATFVPFFTAVFQPVSPRVGFNSVQARAPPALGPPVFLKNCSLLI